MFISGLLFTLVSHSEATPPARGVPTCTGDNCWYEDRPLGVEAVSKNPGSAVHPKLLSDLPAPSIVQKNKFRSLQSKAVGSVPMQHNRKSFYTNLPSYYQNVDRSHFASSERVVFVPKSSSPRLPGINTGDLLNAIVEQSLKASPSVPTPIRAILVSGHHKGALLIGEARLDQELKRVLLTFKMLRIGGDRLYTIQASGLSLAGQIGLEGDYHSETGKFFLAELGSATAAAVADSTIQRSQNIQGNWVQEPSLSNSAKQGVVTSLSRTADRMAEKVRAAPEWTEIPGYQEIKIIITEEPKERS